MINNKIDIDEVIYNLLQGLRSKGYSIGTDAYIKSTELFHWFLKEKKGNTPEDFARYLAPVICKSDDEQTNFKQLFQELFANEFTVFKINLENEIKIKEEAEAKKQRKIVRYLTLLTLVISLLVGLFWLWKHLNTLPIPDYKNLLTQPFYVNRNDSVLLCENSVFKNQKDSSRFTVEYNIHKAKKNHKGFSAKHSFEQYGKDSISVKIKSIKPGIDTTVEFSDIFVGPEKITITPEKNDIEQGEENTYSANIDSTINADFYWEISKENNAINNAQSVIRIKGNPIRYEFKEEGNYLINIKYDVSKNNFPKNFSEEKLSASFNQKVTTAGLKLDVAYTSFPLNIKSSVNNYWLVGLSLLSLLLFYAAIKIIRKKIIKSLAKKNTDVFNGNKPPYDLAFSNRNKYISYTYDLLRLSNHLKKRIDRPDFVLNISKTIKQSIFNRGFPTPGYSQKQETRSCLFLIDQQYKNSQQVKLFSYLAIYLIQHQVKLDFYYYYQNPDKFYTDEDGPGLTLETLKDRYYNCALIFFTDGTNFPQYNASTLKESITIGFAYWQYRILVTPVNYNDWGRNEKLLSSFFNVVPADVVGLLELIKAMDTDGNDTAIMQGNFYTYESKHIDFNTVKGLQEYLADNEIFQWLSALAIHPKIYWEVILEIGKTVVVNPAKINYETLLKLARIKWIHEGNFPTKTRLELLKVLTKENEIKARDTFLKMLDEIPMADDRFSYEEKQISRYTNSFVLFASGIPKYTTDKNIQDGEEKFISLYKNKNIADNALKIYIEKKQTEQGDWETPIISENENAGIENYINDKERDKLTKIKNERLKRNKKFAGYLTGAITALSILIYIFINKDGVTKSSINEYLKLTDTTLLIERSINVSVDTSECFIRLLLLSKDPVATLEIMKGSSVVVKKIIKPGDKIAEPFVVKNILTPNYKIFSYRLIINDEVFKKEMPLLAGNYNISLIGCKDERLSITYHVGYNEDTTAVFNVFKENRNLIKIVTAPDNKTTANRITFDSAIGRNEIFSYADNLIKAGFPLKNVSIRNKQTVQKNINIDGQDSLNKLPNFTSEKLRAVLFLDTNTTVYNNKKSVVKIIYGGDVSMSKIMQIKTCLKNSFDVNTTQITDRRVIANTIKYFKENFKDSVKNLLACLKNTFSEKTFEVIKSTPTKSNTAVAEINLLDESRYIPTVSIAVSDDILLLQANRFRNDVSKAGYKISPISLNQSISSSVIVYHSADQLYSANEIKRIYSNYFRISQINLKYVADANKKYINIEIKKLNTAVTEKIFLNNAKFPTKIKIKNKFPITFTIGFDNLLSSSASIKYYGKICLSENGIKQNKALYICENFIFSRQNKTIISKEIDATFNSSGHYSVRVIIDQLKIDTILGMVHIEDELINNANPICDTIHTYIGPGEDYFAFKGKTYESNSLRKKGIEFSLAKKDAKSVTINISTIKCPLINVLFYSGETKTIVLCDNSKINLTLINTEKTSTNRQNNWALFDAIICNPILNPIQKNEKKAAIKSK